MGEEEEGEGTNEGRLSPTAITINRSKLIQFSPVQSVKVKYEKRTEREKERRDKRTVSNILIAKLLSYQIQSLLSAGNFFGSRRIDCVCVGTVGGARLAGVEETGTGTETETEGGESAEEEEEDEGARGEDVGAGEEEGVDLDLREWGADIVGVCGIRGSAWSGIGFGGSWLVLVAGAGVNWRAGESVTVSYYSLLLVY